jgi:hypothetical protein
MAHQRFQSADGVTVAWHSAKRFATALWMSVSATARGALARFKSASSTKRNCIASFASRRLTHEGHEVLPPLVDVQVVEMRPDRWVLTGFERVSLGALVEPTAFQQSWFIVPKKG